MPTFCNKCIYWEPVFKKSGDAFGLCKNDEVIDKVIADSATELGEDNTLFTQSWFGCVHFREHNGVLIDLSKLISYMDYKPTLGEEQED